ncbi:MAG: hypothetical protein FWG99_06255 [Treponema sp.]|nr:hypothetical protein [Treponema sp.]
MKKSAYICYLLIVICLVSACFSPWTGTEETTLSIVWGGSSDSRFVHSSELEDFRYDVTLKGPGEPVLDSFTGVGGASFSVNPGTWTVTVKGYEFGSAGNVLRVMGIEIVEVKAGKNDVKKIAIYTATEVDSWGELNDAINNTEDNTPSYFAIDPSRPREELIIIKKSFPAGSMHGTINIIRPIILIAEIPVTINRGSQFRESFFTVSGNRLDLGKPGMAGSLTFDGSMSSGEKTDSLVRVKSGAKLVMYSGATIQNNNAEGDGGGVYVEYGGEFADEGGTFSGNSPVDVYWEERQDGPLTAGDFVVTDNVTTYNGQQQGVTVSYFGGITIGQAGMINVYYDGSLAKPINAGEYEITITTEGGTVYEKITEPLSIGTFTINKAHLALSLSSGVLSPIDTITVTASVVSTDTATIGLLVPVPPGITFTSATLRYDGTTEFSNPATTLNFSINVNENVIQNYEVDTISLTVAVNVYDGQENVSVGDIETRRIPVNQGNIQRFNEYANTTNGLTRNYRLTTNITLLSTTSVENNWTPIGGEPLDPQGNAKFTGSFDGMGNTITGIIIYSYVLPYQGMFGYIGSSGIVKNVRLLDIVVTGGDYTGGIAGYVDAADYFGTVQNCYVTGNVIGGINTGGIVGSNSGTVQNCYTSAFVNGNDHVGGIAGENSGTLENCNATENVFGNNCIGGIAGVNSGTLENCYATGNVTGNDYAGGIVGINNSTVQNCVALNGEIEATTTSLPTGASIGRVAGESYAGGAVLSNNYAYDGMLLNGGIENDGSSSNIHGEGVSLTGTGSINNRDWWNSYPMGAGINWGVVDPPGSETSPWVWSKTITIDGTSVYVPKLWFE